MLSSTKVENRMIFVAKLVLIGWDTIQWLG